MAKRKRAPARRSRATKSMRRSRATKSTRRSRASKTVRRRRATKTTHAEIAPPTPNPSPPRASRAGGGEKRAKRGPKPGTRSWRKFNYTPELIADCRRRYEETAEFVTAIARDYGVDECTIRRLAKRHGWRRYRPPPRGLPQATRLRAAAEALEASTLPPRSGGEGRFASRQRGEPGWGDAGGITTSANADALLPPTPDPSPPRAARAGGGEETAATLAGGGEQVADIAATVERLHREALAQLATVETMRARMKRTPQKPADALRTAHTIASLTETINRLQRMSCATPQAYDDDDDMPTDLDAFRNELARRIKVFVASRTGTGDAGGGGEPTVVGEVR